MKKADQKNLAMTAAIMSDAIMKPLYEKIPSYLEASATIADWAIEFEEKHKETDWEKTLEDSLKPLSKEFSPEGIICWDDAVMDFAHYKFELID